MIAICNHDSDSQHYNIVIVVDSYYEHAQLKNSQLKLTNSSDINCIGRQNSNDRQDVTQHYTHNRKSIGTLDTIIIVIFKS